MNNASPFLPSLPAAAPAPAAPGLRPVAASYVVTFLKPEMLHIYRQLTALKAFRPVVLTQKRENAAAFPFEDLLLVPKPRTHALRRLWQKQILGRPISIYRWEARRLLATLHRIDARVLHVYFGHIGVHLLPLLEICDLPVVVSFHGADAQVGLHRQSHLEPTRRVFQKATFLLARSQSLARRLIALGCPPEKIRIHRTGVPLGQIAFRPRTAPAQGDWRCVQACRLIEKKGLKTTLRAFAAFAAVHPRATLTIAGEGPQHAALLELAADLGIAGRLFFPGFLSQEKLGALFSEAHFFLHPSELSADGDQEGVPNAMLEAMAGGLPILATRHGGIVEAVEEGISGRLVAERDDAALARAMLELAADAAAYTAMGEAAARRVAAEFDLGAQARVLEGIYAEALGRHARPSGAAQ